MSPPPSPPWLKILQELVEKYPKETTQSLATLTASGSPTNRSIVHRSFHLPISPPSFQTPSIPVLVSTTDVRSCKSIQISSVSPSVAISWWFPTPNAQFRIEGSARVVAEHDEPEDSDLGRLRKDLWQGMSGHLRATFARTRAPGSRMGAYDEGKGWPETLPTLENAKDEVQRSQVQYAFQNFALVLIVPHHLDYIELTPIPNRRTAWTHDGTGHEWKEEILVP